jgi:hypothetical protein
MHSRSLLGLNAEPDRTARGGRRDADSHSHFQAPRIQVDLVFPHSFALQAKYADAGDQAVDVTGQFGAGASALW